MQYFWRAIATIGIWLMTLTAVTLALTLGNTGGGDVIPLFIGGMFGVIISTGMIWNWGQGLPGEQSATLSTAEKQKRGSRADALIDLLDDDTLDALYRRLSERGSNGYDYDALTIDDEGELVQRRAQYGSR